MSQWVVFFWHADESGCQCFCSTELARVSSQRTGAAAAELVLELFPEAARAEIWHPSETQGGCRLLRWLARGGHRPEDLSAWLDPVSDSVIWPEITVCPCKLVLSVCRF